MVFAKRRSPRRKSWPDSTLSYATQTKGSSTAWSSSSKSIPDRPWRCRGRVPCPGQSWPTVRFTTVGDVRLGRIRRQAESCSGRVLRETPVFVVKSGRRSFLNRYWPVRHTAPHNGVCADGPVNGFQRPSPSRSGGLVRDNVVVLIAKVDASVSQPLAEGRSLCLAPCLHDSRERWYIIVATEVP
jgi:hypothetical protein